VSRDDFLTEEEWLEALDRAEDWDLDGAESGPDYDPDEDPPDADS
jgi:hypothetical protein